MEDYKKVLKKNIVRYLDENYILKSDIQAVIKMFKATVPLIYLNTYRDTLFEDIEEIVEEYYETN